MSPSSPPPRADPFALVFTDLAGPTHWPSIAVEDLPEALAELREWVEELIERFALDIRTLPPCWEQHNAMVELLSALHDHERASFSDKASPTAPVEWFRAFRDIEYQLTAVAARTQCSINEHRADAPSRWATAGRRWDAEPADPRGSD